MSFAYYDLRSESITPSSDNQFTQAIVEGLSRYPKRLPSWLIFDDRGSKIFTEITELEEYHPAQCELEILHTHKQVITDIVSKDRFRIIELGAGDGQKTLVLLTHFIQNQLKFTYVPIDISEGAVKNLVTSLEAQFSDNEMSVKGLAADYFDGLTAIGLNKDQRNIVLFLGSTIGNMELPEAGKFLRKLRSALNDGDYVIIGFDLMKHPKILYSAYNDPMGVFEKFNLHLLDIINNRLGANFTKHHYVQQGQYNPRTHAVESYLYSTRKQVVSINAIEKKFSFDAWEPIQTEHSYKYTHHEIETLATNSGYAIVKNLFDTNYYFMNSIWEVKK
tara:strand:- start:4348 stop:5346 length:999 start_codon:yes stop_codon:yes gene_type:complete